MDEITIGKVMANPTFRNFSLDEKFKMDKNRALSKLKNQGFISRKDKIFSLNEVVLYSVLEDEETFSCLLEEGLVPDFIPNIDNYSLISLACTEAKYKNVKLLLERGYDVNEDSVKIIPQLLNTAWNYTSLHWEVLSILNLLFSYNIDLLSQDHMGNTSLHLVINSSSGEPYQLEIIRSILFEAFHRGEDYLKKLINMKNNFDETILRLASGKENTNIIREILTWDPDTTITDGEDNTFLNYLSPENRGKVELFLESLRTSRMRNKKGIPQK